jgi:hypothetical protein
MQDFGSLTIGSIEKDTSVLSALESLRRRYSDGTLKIVDHWDGDLMAVCVSSTQNPDRLVYFSTCGLPTGRYYVELEYPPRAGSELPYEQGEIFEDVNLEELSAIVAHHLGIALSQ